MLNYEQARDGWELPSSELYAKVDCRAEPPEAIKAHINRYFVTWSFLMVRSAPGL